MKQRKIVFFSLMLALFFVAFANSVQASDRAANDTKNIISDTLIITIPTAERFVLDNGIIVYFIKDSELPLLHLTAVIKGGVADDPVGQEGSAEILLAAMRTGGTKTYSANAIDERLDYLATSISTSAGEEYASLSLSSLRENVDESLAIFGSILQEPLLAPEKIDIQKKLTSEGIKRIPDDAQSLVFQRFNRLMHANNTRCRIPTVDSINSISRDNLISLYENLFNEQNTYIAVSGAIDTEDIKAKLNRAIGAWKVPVKTRTLAIVSAPANNIYFIKKDTPQSIIIKGWLAPQKAADESYPFQIVNMIIGGSTHTSHLFQEIRTNKGLAYAAGSSYSRYRDYGNFVAYAFVKSAATLEALAMMDDIITETHNGKFIDAEIEEVKNSIENRFVFAFTSPFGVASQLLEMEYEYLPADYLSGYCKKIRNITKEQLQAVAKKYLSANSSLTIIIGPSSTLEELRKKEPRVIEIGD